MYSSLMVTDIKSALIRINHVGIINSCLEFELNSILSEALVIRVSFATLFTRLKLQLHHNL